MNDEPITHGYQSPPRRTQGRNEVDVPIGVVAPPDLAFDAFIAFVGDVERLGFDELWIVEDCFLKGGIAQAAVALASTQRVRVGLGILPAGARNAAFAAMEISTLCGLFPDRVIVGIGHGMPTWMRQVGAWPTSPLALLSEYTTALKQLLSGERVERDGSCVQLRDVQLASPPGVIPPVYTGVRGPKSLALSGRVADGTILAEPVSPEYLAVVRKQIGVPREHHRLAAYNVAAVDDSPEHARALARRSLEWIGEPDWAVHIAPLPFAMEFATMRASAGSREEFAQNLPDEWVDQLALVGTPETVRSRLAELSAAGADHLILIPAGPNPRAMLEELARVL
jgi:5,10-methylenetetrahydromethanopterin reductase